MKSIQTPPPTSPNSSNILDAAGSSVLRCTLIILSKAQINQVQDVSQKVTLLRPNSVTKAMDGLFKI